MDRDEVQITGVVSPAQLETLREFLEVFARDTDRHGHTNPCVEEISFSITYLTDGTDTIREEIERAFARTGLTATAESGGEVISDIMEGTGTTWPRYWGIDEKGTDLTEILEGATTDHFRNHPARKGRPRPPAVASDPTNDTASPSAFVHESGLYRSCADAKEYLTARDESASYLVRTEIEGFTDPSDAGMDAYTLALRIVALVNPAHRTVINVTMDPDNATPLADLASELDMSLDEVEELVHATLCGVDPDQYE